MKPLRMMAAAIAALLMALGPAAFLFMPVLALAQSNPGFVNGQPSPTAAQWNSYFSAKTDYVPGTTNAVPYWSAGQRLLSAPVTGDCTSIASRFTCSTLNGVAPGTIYPYNYGTTFTLTGNTLNVTGFANILTGPGSWTTGNLLSAGTYPAVADSGHSFASPGPIGGTTPGTGAFTTLSATGQITSTLSTGTAPFSIASTTVVPNLNASQLLGQTWTSPTITTPTISGHFTAEGVTTTGATGTGGLVFATSPTIASPTFSGTVAGSNTVPLSILAQSAANTMLGNWSGSTANVAAQAMPSCADTSGNHLNYVSGTGIVCGSSSSAGAGWVLISTQTASNSATLQWTGLGTSYTTYALIINNLILASNNQDITLQFGTGSTPTWDTANYFSAASYIRNASITALSATATSLTLNVDTTNHINNAGGIGFSGIFYLHNLVISNGQTTNVVGDSVFWGGGGVLESATVKGTDANNATNKTAVRIGTSSGNITSGSASLYAISNYRRRPTPRRGRTSRGRTVVGRRVARRSKPQRSAA